jgi:disulfide bond formation protein DsbB
MGASGVSDQSLAAVSRRTNRDGVWLWAAFGVAVTALAGSLFLSMGLGLKACPLCFYQRAFVMSIVAVLAMGLVTGSSHTRALAVLCLPLAIAGLGVAIFHVSLELRGKLECPSGVLGLGSAPLQSMVMLGAIFALLLIQALRMSELSGGQQGLLWAVVIGVALAIGSCIANPPMPEAPKQPYAKPPDICRPPFAG